MTVLPGPLHSHKWLHELADVGYTDIWSAKATVQTGLPWRSPPHGNLDYGSVRQLFRRTRTSCMAQSVASMADAAPGRFCIGIGSSSNVIVERWNGVPFEQPYRKVRDMVRFLKEALEGEKVSREFDTFSVNGFRLGVRPEHTPPIFVAALREQCCALRVRRATERSSTGSVLMMCLRWHRLFMMRRVASHVRLSLGSSYARVITLRSFERPQSSRLRLYECAGVCEIPGMAGTWP